MFRYAVWAGFSVLSALTINPAHAGSCVLRPFTAQGQLDVDITAINDLGVAAGVYGPSSPNPVGFTGRSGVVTPILGLGGQGTYSVPTAINDAGGVVGFSIVGSIAEGFLWAPNKFIGYFDLGSMSDGSNPPLINSKGWIAFNYYEGAGYSKPFLGPINAFVSPPLANQAIISGFNASNMVVGTEVGFIRNNPAYEVFLSTRLGVTQVLPPHAVNSYGAVLDDAGRIGGIFADPSGDLHGFSFFSGRYSVFDMPSKPTAIYLGGIGGNGNIVGIFTTQTTRNAFLYSGGKLEIIGTWALADNARIMISPHAQVIAISVQVGGQGHFESFFGACN